MPEFDLFPGDQNVFSKTVKAELNGDYEVKVHVDANEDGTNFSEAVSAFSAVNQQVVSLCQTIGTTMVEDLDGLCRLEYQCSQCSFGFECKQAWEQQTRKVLTELDRETAFELVSKVNGVCLEN